MSLKLDVDKYKKMYEEEGYKVLNFYKIGRRSFFDIEDKDGFRYKKEVNSILYDKSKKGEKFGTRNPFLLYNLSIVAEKRNKNVTILEHLGGKKIKISCELHGESIVNKDFAYDDKKYICPKCGNASSRKSKRIPEEEIIKRCEELNVDFVGTFINERKQTSVKFICRSHKEKGVQTVKWDSMKRRKTSCNYCDETRKMTHEEFVDYMKEYDDTIIILGKYENRLKPIKCKCGICGHKWEMMPCVLKKGRGCPICNMPKGEKRIYNVLKNNNIEFEMQKTFEGLLGIKGGNLSYDFYVKDYNLLIEFQGKQHYEPVLFIPKNNDAEENFEKQKEHDKRKREYAKDNGYKLLEIKYDEYDNIEEILEKELHIKNIA